MESTHVSFDHAMSVASAKEKKELELLVEVLSFYLLEVYKNLCKTSETFR